MQGRLIAMIIQYCRAMTFFIVKAKAAVAEQAELTLWEINDQDLADSAPDITTPSIGQFFS